MEIQWPLLIFSVLLGVTSGSFVFLAVGELRGKFRDVRFAGALIALICLAVGGCVSVLHMGHPERATHLLGNLGSGLSKELFVVAIMGIVALIYLVLAKKDYPTASKVSGVLGAVLGLVLPFVAGASYLIAARPAWDSIALPLMFLGGGLAMGMTLMCGLVLLSGADDERGFALKLALAGVLIACMTNSGSPAVGVDYTFNAMAAIVIGGTPFIGGKGGIGGTILGALLMKILASGLSLVGIPATWQKAITGFVIVALIIIDVVNDHRKNIKAQRRVYNNVG